MHGIIVIDKPAGPTSAEVVRMVKARLGRKSRVGHLGTLDPFATGVLPILVGEGTKLAPFLQESEKEYCGLIAVGAETDTLDRTGEVVRTAAVPALDTARLNELAARFCGEIEQTPPIFSALKRDGVPLYKLARRGDEVAPPPPRRVEIKQLALTNEGQASIRFSVVCSPGMYVRSLARDLGIAMDSAAHLAELRRLRNGAFSIDRAVTLATALEQLERGDRSGLIGLRAALPGLAEIDLDDVLARRLRNGDARALDGLIPHESSRFKVIARGELAAIAEPTSRITATILRIFNAD
jgi:tRNA pseudouridine55 synthase